MSTSSTIESISRHEGMSDDCKFEQCLVEGSELLRRSFSAWRLKKEVASEGDI